MKRFFTDFFFSSFYDFVLNCMTSVSNDLFNSITFFFSKTNFYFIDLVELLQSFKEIAIEFL